MEVSAEKIAFAFIADPELMIRTFAEISKSFGRGEKSWEGERRFIDKVGASAEKYHTSVKTFESLEEVSDLLQNVAMEIEEFTSSKVD